MRTPMDSPAPAVIDYRNPRDAAFRQRVRGMLVRREAALKAKLVAMFVGGLVTSFVAPAVATLVVIHVQQRWGSGVFFKFEAALIFVIASLMIIPLLYLVEHLTRRRFFEDAVRKPRPGRQRQLARHASDCEPRRVRDAN